MKQFQVYRSGEHQYLAVTEFLALRIVGRKLSAKLYRLKSPVAVKTTEVSLIIEKPSKAYDSLQGNISDARNHWVELGRSGSLESRRYFFREVLSACSYFDPKTRRHLTLRDVAKRIGIKSYATYYKQLHLEARRQLNGREKAISSAKDLTLIQSVKNFQKLWPSIIGYSKRLDTTFKYELKLYTSAMRARSLRLED